MGNSNGTSSFEYFDKTYQQWNPEIKEYFDNLPPHIQETIKQSGTEIHTLDHLKDIAKHYQNET